jgi:hypothetical protein
MEFQHLYIPMVVFFLRASENSSTHFVTILDNKTQNFEFYTNLQQKRVFVMAQRKNMERKLTGRSGKIAKSEVRSCSAFCSMDALLFTLPCANFKGSPAKCPPHLLVLIKPRTPHTHTHKSSDQSKNSNFLVYC